MFSIDKPSLSPPLPSQAFGLFLSQQEISPSPLSPRVCRWVAPSPLSSFSSLLIHFITGFWHLGMGIITTAQGV